MAHSIFLFSNLIHLCQTREAIWAGGRIPEFVCLATNIHVAFRTARPALWFCRRLQARRQWQRTLPLPMKKRSGVKPAAVKEIQK